MIKILYIAAILAGLALVPIRISAEEFIGPAIKTTAFKDPNTGDLYILTSHNLTGNPFKDSTIRVKRSVAGSNHYEFVNRLDFRPTLVDYSLHCMPTHCYMVTVVNSARDNVELYAWKRTQFDLLIRKSSFARPAAVKIFKIQNAFHIAVAQEQLHLERNAINYQGSGSMHFIGCAIFKFFKGQEVSIRYHQFIRLPYDPLFVDHFTAMPPDSASGQPNVRSTENHFVVFGLAKDWHRVGAPQSFIFTWSPFDTYFWPYKLPRSVSIVRKPDTAHFEAIFPPQTTRPANFSTMPLRDQHEPIEICFSQLQRVLDDRDLRARQLRDFGRHIWTHPNGPQNSLNPVVVDVKSRVIVHGNVVVTGGMPESPQITVVNPINPMSSLNQVIDVVDVHSPALVEQKLNQAYMKMSRIKDQLRRAVPFQTIEHVLSSPIRFHGHIRANNIIFRGQGIVNQDVRINTIPFHQLHNELVSLNGAQNVNSKVTFTGRVFADVLEIWGKVNDRYFMSDAFDIKSPVPQIFEVGPKNPIVFQQISTSHIALSPNATLNTIQLGDFITRDNTTQAVYGLKTFQTLSMSQMTLAHSNVMLNKFNLTHLAHHAIKTGAFEPTRRPQYLSDVFFAQDVLVDHLFVNGPINNQVNLTTIIQESVKTEDAGVQHIVGQKNFMNNLRIANLMTSGSLNNLRVSQMFNTNPLPPIPEYQRYINTTGPLPFSPVAGRYIFYDPVLVRGSLTVDNVNDVNFNRHVVRRMSYAQSEASKNVSIPPEQIYGKKIFGRPLRVLGDVRFLDQPQIAQSTNQTIVPMINGFNLRALNQAIDQRMRNPQIIYIDNLEIRGNIHLDTRIFPESRPSTIFGGNPVCPLDALKSRTVTSGGDQMIELPLVVDYLRAQSAIVDPGALNELNFPNDFVRRSAPIPALYDVLEPIYGFKTFDSLVFSPHSKHQIYQDYSRFMNPNLADQHVSKNQIIFGSHCSLNGINQGALQVFIAEEQQRNSTGEHVFHTIEVHGNLMARKINGYHWPDDILLDSLLQTNYPPIPNMYHKRIYSPMIFTETSSLVVDNQLVSKGPIELLGTLNGRNISEFARQSATFGDKELLSGRRPLRNKIFAGGITVTGEIRSQGLIDSVDFETMKRRVVTIGPNTAITKIVSPKLFMSDVTFLGPLTIAYLRNTPVDDYLRRITFENGTNVIHVKGKKIITGALRAGKTLTVVGTINNIDFTQLEAKAITLAPTDQLNFNKTLTIEGDAYMDNLIIDEKNGTIDNVRLINLLPISQAPSSELYVMDPQLVELNNQTKLVINGTIHDCRVTCDLDRPHYPMMYNQTHPIIRPQPLSLPLVLHASQPRFIPPPVQYQHLNIANYPPRPVIYQGRNITYMQSTPPYAGYVTTAPVQTTIRVPNMIAIHSLANRPPASINFERKLEHSVARYDKSVVGKAMLGQLPLLRNQIISLNLVSSSRTGNLVVGFIDALTDDVGHLIPDDKLEHPVNAPDDRRSKILDSIDLPVPLRNYHLDVKLTRDSFGNNLTRVVGSINNGPEHVLSHLPIDNPNSASFLFEKRKGALFLLISKDYTVSTSKLRPMCPVYVPDPQTSPASLHYGGYMDQSPRGLHVYLFHSLQNSSFIDSSYFDLYQTIDLPAIDNIVTFDFMSSPYALAVSKQINRIYLLILRGYSGFQVVSFVDVPMIDYIMVARPIDKMARLDDRITRLDDKRPVIIVHQTDGLYKVLESVVI